MDYVDKANRARWQSLNSIVRFGWAGSAALGGVLADRYGYTSTFLITAAVQAAGTLVQCLLLPMVPRKEARTAEQPASLAPLQAVVPAPSEPEGREEATGGARVASRPR